VRNDGLDVEARLEHDGHLVPGLIHLAAVDALDGEHVEDDGVPVDGHGLGGDAEHRDPGAVAHVGEHVAEAGGVAGHLEAHVEPLRHAELLLHVGEFGGADIHGAGHAHRLRQVEAVRVDVRDDGVARAGVVRDGGGHDADRAGAGDQHVLAEDREGERGVDRVAEGIEDGGNVERDGLVVAPDVGHRQRDVLRERAGAVHADPLRMRADMATSGEAVATAAADDVAFAADDVAREEVGHVGPDLDDPADELMPDRHGDGDRLLRPIVPLVDVDVRAADPGPQHLDQDVVDADLRLVDVLQPQAGLAPALAECFHSSTITR
jgi:hypothetical protein